MKQDTLKRILKLNKLLNDSKSRAERVKVLKEDYDIEVNEDEIYPAITGLCSSEIMFILADEGGGQNA